MHDHKVHDYMFLEGYHGYLAGQRSLVVGRLAEIQSGFVPGRIRSVWRLVSVIVTDIRRSARMFSLQVARVTRD